MRSLRVWLLLAWLPLLAGCFPAIYSEQPLGDVAVLDPRAWDGLWLDADDNLIALVVVDSHTLVSRKERVCDPSPIANAEAEATKLRHFGNLYLVEMRSDTSDESVAGLYTTRLVMMRKGNVLVLYWIDETRAEALVAQGALPGRIENGRVILGALTPEQGRVLFRVGKESAKYPRTAKDDPPVFWVPIGTLTKLPYALDPCKRGEQPK